MNTMKSHCFDRKPVLHYLLVLFMLLSTNLHGRTYTVSTENKLNEAISDATGGDMEDTIIFAADIVLNEPLWQILMGDETLTIEGNGHTLSRNPTAPTFRILAVVGGTVTINNLTITGGHSDSYSGIIVDGGGISNQSSMLTLNNCTISGNKAQGNGGGISNRLGVFGQSSSVTLNNCTISGNTALGNTANGGNGAGVFNESGEMKLNNCTVSNNSAERHGGGIYHYGGTLTLIRSIVSGNSAHGGEYQTHEGDELYQWGGVINADAYNVLGHSWLRNDQAFWDFTPGATDKNCTQGGADSIELEFILSALADNGGPTLTHALGEWSPAVNIAPAVTDGDNPTPSTDQRGIARPQGSKVDAGAYEYVCDPSMTVSLTTLDFAAAGESLALTVSSNVVWTATNAPDWLTITPISGIGNGTVTVTASGNTGLARSGSITFSANGVDDAHVNISQASGVVPPSVSTFAAAGIGLEEATLGGNVSADGGAEVTERGVVFSSIDSTPTIGESGVTQVDIGIGIGDFSQTVFGLTPGTTYHVRAYASNGAETGYGDAMEFSTLARHFSANETALNLDSGLVFAQIVVSANLEWTAESSDDSWLTVSPTSGSGDGTLTVTASANTGLARSGSITFSATGVPPVTVTVTQAAGAVPPNMAPRLQIIGNKTVKAGQSITFQIIADDEEDNVLQYSAANP